MKKIVVFTNYTRGSVVAELTTRSTRDPLKAFREACRKASEDNVNVMSCEIPDKYLEAEKVRMKILDSTELAPELLASHTAPVVLCRCQDCSAYEEGHCFKYGGMVDGFETSEDVVDCIHGTCGHTLVYIWTDDHYPSVEEVVSYAFYTDLSPAETAEYLRSTEDADLQHVRQQVEAFYSLATSAGMKVDRDRWDFLDN